MSVAQPDVSSPSHFMMLLITIALMPLSILVTGYVTETVWNWFVPVLSAAIPLITFGQAVAVRCVLYILIYQYASSPDYEGKKTTYIIGDLIGRSFVTPFIILALLWTIHLFVHVKPEM